jgi:hypothetical protein
VSPKAAENSPQLSLRVLLLGVALAAAWFAVLGWELQNRRREERLLAEARALCQSVRCLRYERVDQDGATFVVAGSVLTPEMARAIVSAKRIATVKILGSGGEPARAVLREGFQLESSSQSKPLAYETLMRKGVTRERKI